MKSDMDFVPAGWVGLDIDGAYINGTQLVIFGSPAEGSEHNCDAMGCSTLNHVLVRCHIPEWQAAQHSLHTDAASAAVTPADTAPEQSPVKPAGSQAAPVS